MKINNIEPTNFGTSVSINRVKNNGHKYLYNEISNLVSEYKIPAEFKTSEIELPRVSVSILRRLNELKIKFKSKQ